MRASRRLGGTYGRVKEYFVLVEGGRRLGDASGNLARGFEISPAKNEGSALDAVLV
jgi:hypothetical protein